jgi:hypothetical protein
MMPRGREPEGETPLSNAERQARFRARHKAAQPIAVSRRRRPVDRRSRVQRWNDATGVLIEIQTDCAAWLDALPESLRGTATAEALQAIVDLDLETLAAIEPPRGYGRE